MGEHYTIEDAKIDMARPSRVATLTIPIESRATVEAKAIRIILERRLTVLLVKGPRVYAEVRGSEDRVYHCGYGAKTGQRPDWWCHCDAKGRCSHLAALQLVTIRPDA